MYLLCVSWIVLVVFSSAQHNDPCQPYTQGQISATCDEQNVGGDYSDLSNTLHNAVAQSVTDFVMHATLSMYRYLHPCASRDDAALVLFYNFTDASLHGSGSGPLVGRRKRQDYQALAADLDIFLDGIRLSDGAGCIMHLIRTFTNVSAQAWRELNPDFHPSTITTAATTTISALGTTTCSVCEETGCQFWPETAQCPSGLCMTTLRDSATGRSIVRDCAEQATCDVQYLIHTLNNPLCRDIDSHTTNDREVTCYFCCHGDNCNHPHQITPPADTLYCAEYPKCKGASSTSSTGTVCASCEGLACVMGNAPSVSCPSDQSACYTQVHEIALGMRNVQRGCASQSECAAVVLDAGCSGVEQQILPAGTVCKFCCTGAHCNQPPNIIPRNTTTTTTTITTVAPVVCASCEGMDCVLGTTSRVSCSSDHTICFTEVHEVAFGVRNLRRGCASQSECTALVLDAGCSHVEQQILPAGTACKFCCTGSHCNQPPNIIPRNGS